MFIFLNKSATISFSRRTLLCGFS